jgi:hypothetical protein
LNKGPKQRAGRFDHQIRMEITCKVRAILERIFLDSRIKQELEWIDRGEIRDEIYFDNKLVRLVLKNKAR